MKRILILAACLGIACRPETHEPTFDPTAHEAEVKKWQQERDQRLRREDSWLTLVGLHWLEAGPNTIGSDKSNKIVLPPNAPPAIGTLTVASSAVTFDALERGGATIDGKPVQGRIVLKDDSAEDGPTLVHARGVNFQIIKRGDRFGVRVKDPKAETRTHFRGLEYFPIDPRWRVVARFEPYAPLRQIPITDITGMVAKQTVPGALLFDVGGKEYRLDPVAEEGSKELFVIFKDATSRDLTYPAGRYMYVSRPGADGKVVMDFNKAYNPPCVFTPFATCPLPPVQNRLPIRIEAGEKNYKH